MSLKQWIEVDHLTHPKHPPEPPPEATEQGHDTLVESSTEGTGTSRAGLQSELPRMNTTKPPVRACRLTMALEADTRTEMAWALRNLADRVEREEVSVGCWGSPSDGAIYELLVDPSITHDSYHSALRSYLDGKRSKTEST